MAGLTETLRPPRRPRQALHGVLLLDKPLGLSSNDALQKAKRLLNAEKAGHTGTLDPLASGLLPLCFGAATKFAQVNLEADKRYMATVRLGLATTTGDREGEPVGDELAAPAAADAVRSALAALVGPQRQTPPMHSALKHGGRKLYELAREGIEVEREGRDIVIHGLELLSYEAPLAVVDVRCSKGTYVRTLAEAIGARLGMGAHLHGLRRTASGPVALGAGVVTLEQLAAMDAPERVALLGPVDALLADWPAIALDEADAARFLTGLRRRTGHADATRLRVFGPERRFLGIGHVTAGELIPDRLLSPVEVSAAQGRAPASIDGPGAAPA